MEKGDTTFNIYYSPAYARARHEFDTTRKAAWVAESLERQPIAGVRLVEPRLLTRAELARVHTPDYVDAVAVGRPLFLAESNGFSWDRELWTAVTASSGGAVAAALHALTERHTAGSLSSGLHHASASMGCGFCTFNGLALAARAARDAGASRLLIIDLDAHCGGGTYSIVREWEGVMQLDISVSGFDSYSPNPESGFTLDLVRRADEYLPTLRRRLDELMTMRFDLVLYNAGMDPHEGSAIGGLDGITDDVIAEREATMFEWARQMEVPVAFVLAGGYSGVELSRDALVGLHRITIEAAVGVDSLRAGLKPCATLSGSRGGRFQPPCARCR